MTKTFTEKEVAAILFCAIKQGTSIDVPKGIEKEHLELHVTESDFSVDYKPVLKSCPNCKHFVLHNSHYYCKSKGQFVTPKRRCGEEFPLWEQAEPPKCEALVILDEHEKDLKRR